MRPIINKIGITFGRLTAIGGPVRSNGKTFWQCVCECGREKTVDGGNLTSGNVKSCGCLLHEVIHGANRNGKRTTEYRSLAHIIQRCTNPNDKNFKDYGGRGITVCDKWSTMSGFMDFLSHVGLKPSCHHSIDRVDNSKGYTHGNVRWATQAQQVRNTRTSRMVHYDGRSMCVTDWEALLGMNRGKLKQRLNAGWTVDRALNTP